MTTFHVHIPVIETERLRLRDPRLSDLDAYAEYGASDRSRIVGGPFDRGHSFERLAALLGHWQLRGFGRWMIADKETDAPLGVGGLMDPDDWPEPEIAWTVFGHAEGKGIAYEAALATRAYAYDTLGWTRVVSCISPDNTRSLALARRMGAVHESDYEHETIGTLQVWRHLGPEEL